MESEVLFPTRFRELGRVPLHDRFVLLGVLVVILGGALRFSLSAMDVPAATVVFGTVYAIEAGLSLGLLAVLARRTARTPRTYLLGAALATGLVFAAEPAGILGGFLALLGCVWGYMASAD